MSATRQDAEAKLKGQAEFGVDLYQPEMLWGALVLAPVAHGKIRRVDLGAARKSPGVVAAIGAEDLKGLLPKGGGDPERPVFPREETVYLNQPLAAIAAESLSQARAGARAVQIDVDPLPIAGDLDDLFPDWPEGKATRSPAIAAHVLFRHGDLPKMLRVADFVHSETYRTSGVQQVALEPHSCLAEVGDGRWRVRTSTQSPFGVREDVADILGIPERTLIVEGTWVGGGFGGKAAALLEPIALVLAAAARRPVKLALSYTEEFLLGRSTLPSVVRIETAVQKGRMTARRIRMLLDGGASLPGRDFAVGYSMGFLMGPYRIPVFEVEGYAIRTNKPPFGPHRAPFAPQCAFVAESHMDSLARRLKIDPIVFRLAHVWKEGDTTFLGQKIGPFGLAACLEKARATAERWRPDRKNGTGIGVGCGIWSTNAGAGGSARLLLSPTGLVIDQGEREIGNGSVVRGLVAVAERVLGLPADAIQVQYADTSKAPFDSGVFGSRTLAALGQAVEKAARTLLKTLAARMEKARSVTLDFVDHSVWVVSDGARVPLAKLWNAEEKSRGHLMAEASHYARASKLDEQRVVEGAGFPFTDFTGAAHAAEVQVDRETGTVQVVRYAAFQDVGVAIDPVMVRGQIEGGIAMGLGEALTEESLWTPEGRLANPTLLDYRIPTLGEIPNSEIELVEGFPGAGPFGAKGVGEPPIIPVPAAVANAVADAIGARIYELPLSAERVARALNVV